jgi:hypothetical protein
MQKYQDTLDAIAEYFRFFDQHRIYIPESVCGSLDGFAKKLRAITGEFGVYLELEQANCTMPAEKLKAWIEAWKSVQNDVPTLRSELEKEFRKLLGATTAGGAS